MRPVITLARRFLHLHEYQSKDIMKKYGLSVQKFQTVGSSKDQIDLQAAEYVIKAQIHAGGRGKGKFSSGLQGGVHLTKDVAKIPKLLDQMIDHKLVTPQTTSDGIQVKKVMVAEALDIKRETYLAILMDRSAMGPVLVASSVGGMDIEEVAAATPEKIIKLPIDLDIGVTEEIAKYVADQLGFTGTAREEAADQIKKLYRMFLEIDATQVEINPFGETDKGKVVCFDAKINFDDNAQFRQQQIFNDRDVSEEDPREVQASTFNLNYIGMDGSIGCLVNGAGLAMATMDIIKLHGASPANFLDVGGSANANAVKEAFKIITMDPNVSAILVNIFGGIMKCDTIAEGIVAAARESKLKVPLVVRLSGTNHIRGKEILSSSGLPITVAEDLDDAAVKAVSAAV